MKTVLIFAISMLAMQAVAAQKNPELEQLKAEYKSLKEAERMEKQKAQIQKLQEKIDALKKKAQQGA